MNKLKNISKIVVSSFFPNTCVSCGDIIDEGEYLCDFCHEMIDECDPLKRCIKCGLEKGECACKKNVYHFDGCIAPFYNTGIAKTSMYGLKFRRKPGHLDFFANRMAISIRNEYRDILFDGICYVPMSITKEHKRGFNQSRIIAKKISKICGIPFIENALICNKSNYAQHELSVKERFSHVKGLYKWKVKNTGKTLLLVDDIKTTGATLDECSRQLLLSGADKVYCVTGLISEIKNT